MEFSIWVFPSSYFPDSTMLPDSPHAAFSIRALTGTPIENRPSELWSIFDFLMSGYLRTYDAFRMEFEIPVMKEKNREASVRLQKLVSPFILRRLKSDVLKDLPEKLEEVSLCELTGEQRKAL